MIGGEWYLAFGRVGSHRRVCVRNVRIKRSLLFRSGFLLEYLLALRFV